MGWGGAARVDGARARGRRRSKGEGDIYGGVATRQWRWRFGEERPPPDSCVARGGSQHILGSKWRSSGWRGRCLHKGGGGDTEREVASALPSIWSQKVYPLIAMVERVLHSRHHCRRLLLVTHALASLLSCPCHHCRGARDDVQRWHLCTVVPPWLPLRCGCLFTVRYRYSCSLSLLRSQINDSLK